MNPERAAINSLDNRKRIDEIKETAQLLLPTYGKIAEIMEKISIHPENFENLYGAETIQADRQYVARMKEKFKQEDDEAGPNGLTKGDIRKIAEILEFQIIRGINQGLWLPGCTATKTTEYDDIRHGVDLVLTYEKDLRIENMGIGVDVSFSHNLQNKFQRIKDEIDSYDTTKDGQLGVVKYFHQRKTGFRGELSNLPRVVIALDIGVMKDLARAKEGGKDHMARHSILSEMEMQLAVFADYAQKQNPACLDHIMRAQNFVRGLINELNTKEILQNSQYEKNIRIQEAVEKGLSLFR